MRSRPMLPINAAAPSLFALTLLIACGETTLHIDFPPVSDGTGADSGAGDVLDPPQGDAGLADAHDASDAAVPVAASDAGARDDDEDESDAASPPVPDAGEVPSGDAGAAGDGERPVLYSDGWVRSPIAPSVVKAMREIAERQADRDDRTFIKVGDSHTVNTNFMRCFASDGDIDLDGRSHLSAAITAFRAGTENSFSRTSLAAKVGMSASWALAADATGLTPVDQEIGALNPRFALVSYGTNDMQSWGEGPYLHQNAVWAFYKNMSALLDHLIEQGIVPIVTGLLPRGDSAKFPDAPLWVPAYNALTRGMAEARQIPWFDMYGATKDIPGQALAADGLHGNASPHPCDFSPSELTYNYNLRNLHNMELLNDAYRSVVLGEGAPDTEGMAHLSGTGAPDDPFEIERLPFTHRADTAASPVSEIDAYPACSTADESGAELYYRLTLARAANLRLLVFSEGSADIDLHVLSPSGAGAAGCIARHDKIIQRRFDPGTHDIVLDSYAGKVGRYQLLILECEAGDPSCGS